MTAELPLTESQKLKVGSVIREPNKNGCFITASGYGEILRVCASKKEIERLEAEILKLG